MADDSPQRRWVAAVNDLSEPERAVLGSSIVTAESGQLSARQRAVVRKLLRALDTDAYELPIPVRRWTTWARQPRQTVVDRSELLGLPVKGGISLPEFVAALYRLIDEQIDALTGSGKAVSEAEPKSPFLELGRRETWRLRRLERIRKEGQVVSVSFMRDAMHLVTSILRKAGSRIHDQFGERAYEVLDEALDAVDKAVKDMFIKGVDKEAASVDVDLDDDDLDGKVV